MGNTARPCILVIRIIRIYYIRQTSIVHENMSVFMSLVSIVLRIITGILTKKRGTFNTLYTMHGSYRN